MIGKITRASIILLLLVLGIVILFNINWTFVGVLIGLLILS